MVDTHTITLARIPTRGLGLGRHVHHDERSKAYRIPKRGSVNQSRKWPRVAPVLDQTSYGACVGFGWAGVLGTEPYWSTLHAAFPSLTITADEALMIYSLATQLDPFPGAFTYPPPGGQDTGSDGLSGAKALMPDHLGLIVGYQHALSLDDVITALQIGPVVTGVNWYSSFDVPSSTGLVTLTPSGSIRGGHEFEISEVDLPNRMLGAWQSWGPKWGLGGQFYFSFDDYTRLLAEDGDATQPVPMDKPVPVPVPVPPSDPDKRLAVAGKDWTAARHTGSNRIMAGELVRWMKARGFQ